MSGERSYVLLEWHDIGMCKLASKPLELFACNSL